MQLFNRLWHDERGFVVSSELILLATIVVIGLLVGITVWRDAVVQELGDTGAAIGQFNQSYAIEVTGPDFTVTGDWTTGASEVVELTKNFPPTGTARVTVNASFNNFGYIDQADVCDELDVAASPPAGISLNQPPVPEGYPLP